MNKNKKFTLKVIQKEDSGEGKCLGSSDDIDRKSALYQWLITKRDKGITPFFLALCDENDDCIDAKYIPIEEVRTILKDWGHVSD
ncbi:hypothetical protein [Vibrio marisflavi]|uniref:Uncharacterized protein n=1 Tax=Vibrio marisflavi CECT 7928 TaxID=634439 RepID=A0ABN8E4E9_9VIBR|nr:hypothetical protein [Vibrio marisflavi]CAH0538977.1 hypothetical protein VMF7928_01807 [Vibrio marisflavi CECT 7928]